ncbi:MAG: permease prefix domain 1-containing protein [Phycisphaerales bacterium]
MLRSTSQTRDAKRMTVAPSNRDSIGSWLDVLTSMLSLPEGERLQVRDELEDHLRSRVDDLLITGTDEQEAVRIAVAELGETAELAKLITHAHTRANPRRRIMNTALIMAAVAGLSIGGISLSNQQVGEVGTAGVNPVVVVDDGGEDRDEVHAFDMGMVSAHGVLREIARVFDRSINVSREVTNTQSAMTLGVHTPQFFGEMNFEQAIAEFKNQFDEVSGEYHLAISEDSIVYQTVDEHQRSRIVTRVLPSSDWIESHELFDYADSLEKLLSVKHDLSMASIEVINEAIIVAAVPEVHEEVLKLVFELDAVIEQRLATRLKKEEAERHARDVERSKAYERILVRHADIVGDIMKAKEEVQENYESIQILIKRIQDAEEHPDESTVGVDELKGFLDARRGLANRLLAQIKQDEDRERYLREKMVETEFLYLFDGLE